MKVGVVTYVHGWYQDYIPFFIYSIHKSYPEYTVRIFLRESLNDITRRNLMLLRDKCDFQIQEHYLDHLGRSDDAAKKPYYLRWLIPEYSFKGIDCAFVCDVDLLMLHEKQPMHEQRLEICDLNAVPFANYERDPHEEYPPRITGWHFIKVGEYFKQAGAIIDRLRNQDIDITSLQHKYCYPNGLGEMQWGQESLLHFIIRESFGQVDLTRKFPTHHGIHLGPIRADLHKRFYAGDRQMRDRFGLNGPYWTSAGAFEYINDKMVKILLANLGDCHVKTIITKFIEDLSYVLL